MHEFIAFLLQAFEKLSMTLKLAEKNYTNVRHAHSIDQTATTTTHVTAFFQDNLGKPAQEW